MKLRRLTLAVCVLSLLATATAQLSDCELSDLFSGGTIEGQMSRAITQGDSPTPPVITVLRNHTVCESVGPTRGKISSISLVIEYMCTESAQCPGMQPTEQFDFGCNSDGEWIFNQFADVDNARTPNPTANFDTTVRTDCGACFPVHPDMTNPPTIDPVTHCHECRGCRNRSTTGEPSCFGSNEDQCCNVYVNNMCADDCPSDGNYTIDMDTYVCIQLCDDLGDTTSGGSVTYTQEISDGGYPEGSVATVTCGRGYTGGGDITCASGSWSGSLPECSVIDCGVPPNVTNGKVQTLTGTTFGSMATYECNDNYLFADEDVKSKTCQADGEWSDEDIRCELDMKECSPACKNGGTCNMLTGQCICPPGLTGVDCGMRLCPECQNGGSCDAETGMCVCPPGFIGLECEPCNIPDCSECVIEDGKFVCVECNEDFEKSNDKCEPISGNRDDELCLLCIILPIVAVILAIIAAIAIAVAIYVYRKWKSTPAIKLKDKEANGLNGVARDNPLYLDPSTVEQEVG